ncbi:MAG TPA: carboxypeptidase-like regulatory domain-containing protein [Terriglobia bacterium]|nr:carboxypeptidase-like regulatory domain-containing protein [Terriglobia bacterium]
MKKKRKNRTGSEAGLESKQRGVACRSQRRYGSVAIILVACSLTLAPAGVMAKKKKPPTKTVTGEVLDKANNPIVGASVELTDLRTGKKLAIYSEAGGRYSFAGLAPTDDYQVQATHQGQSSELRKASSLDDRLIMVLNLHIPPPPEP